MSCKRLTGLMFISASALVLSACGGGGEMGIASTPPAAVSPTPSPTPASPGAGATSVTIFKSPQAGTYATVGLSLSGGNLFPSASAVFGALSSDDASQPHIRYSAADYYEIEFPNTNWDGLVHYKALQNPTSLNMTFEPASTNGPFVTIERAQDSGYLYSELASWGSSTGSRFGWMAFGVPTPQGGVPVTGSATYNGLVHGSADIMEYDLLAGGYFPASVDGTVELNFGFAQGTLSGAAKLYLPDGMQPLGIGSFAFKNNVFSVGAATYSGQFETSASGQNYFLGRFTGPNAAETIGTWAVPFKFTTSGQTLKADGQTHQAFGAWIANKP